MRNKKGTSTCVVHIWKNNNYNNNNNKLKQKRKQWS